VDDAVALAIAANVKKLFLFHHDPDRDDKHLDELLKHAHGLVSARKSKLKVDAAREGMSIKLPDKAEQRA
jgi:ribonuclease BN (tRNA processing enzyme)